MSWQKYYSDKNTNSYTLFWFSVFGRVCFFFKFSNSKKFFFQNASFKKHRKWLKKSLYRKNFCGDSLKAHCSRRQGLGSGGSGWLAWSFWCNQPHKKHGRNGIIMAKCSKVSRLCLHSLLYDAGTMRNMHPALLLVLVG